MRIGFDLDGVLCNIDVALLRIMDNMPKHIKKTSEEWYYRERKPLLNPKLIMSKDDEMVIITSRAKNLRKITKRWVKKYLSKTKLYIISPNLTLENVTDHHEVKKWLIQKAQDKAQLINELKLDIYIDDSHDMVTKLRELCPNTKIIQYGGRL